MRTRCVLSVLETLSRLGLGALFVYSAWGKIDDPGVFAYSVGRYRILPDCAIGLFSLTMPMLELLAGLAMLFTRWLREASLLIAGMLALFIVALAQALARGLEISCGCFGVPSVGGREEIMMALARDVALIVPAVWLMFRPNAWLWPLGTVSRSRRAACLCGAGALLAFFFARDLGGWDARDSREYDEEEGADGASRRKSRAIEASAGPVRAGKWNLDFTNVVATAEREHRPMVLLKVNAECMYCARLERAVRGAAFRQWCAERSPLLAFVNDGHPDTPSEVAQRSLAFVTNGAPRLKDYPFVSVYWPRADVTNRAAFCGRTGHMGVARRKSLAVEFLSALDRALGFRASAAQEDQGLEPPVVPPEKASRKRKVHAKKNRKAPRKSPKRTLRREK